jgi:putative inorganic carbon (HCO3(-)) transporter
MSASEIIKSNEKKLFYGIGLGFILLNAIFTAQEIFWIGVLPFVFFLLFYLFVSVDKILWFIVFSTPLAINVPIKDFGLAISLPTEPLMISILAVFLLKLFYEGKLDRKLVYHPISLSILFYLGWMMITSVTSDLPAVSFKYFLSKLWFIVCFYYYGYFLFQKKQNINRFFWAYCIPFVLVIGYTVFEHSQYGFDQKTANWVMSPFYNDHTAYGAMLAFFVPGLLGLSFMKDRPLFQRAVAFLFFLIFIFALVLSYSRAAWVSLAGALAFFSVLYFRINFKFILLSLFVLVIAYFSFREQLLVKLERNRQDSSTNLTEHVRSISNISSDASNLERLNRWQSAFRMFKERPVFGWGPGTYSFKYAPFQFSYEKTIISTNSGDRGNAHSEYIGPLAESGVLGTVSFVLMMIAIFFTGVRLYPRLEQKNEKIVLVSLLAGLVTYFIHGGLNNFLDTDKASVPFWGFIAAIVALDIYQKQKSKEIKA